MLGQGSAGVKEWTKVTTQKWGGGSRASDRAEVGFRPQLRALRSGVLLTLTHTRGCKHTPGSTRKGRFGGEG